VIRGCCGWKRFWGGFLLLIRLIFLLAQFTTGDFAITGAGTGVADMTCCDIDLTAPPFGVVAGDQSAGAANTAAINAAITAYSGTRARLLLPAGDIYVDQANGHDNWSVKFAAGVSDLALAGHGMFASRIVIQGAGDGGEWHGIMVDGASRIEFSDFGIQMGVVGHLDAGDQNHLVSIYCSAGQTSDIVGHRLFFGQAVGDGLRIFGDASAVTNIRFTDFTMRMAGIGAGSRSGVAMQRGWSIVELGNFYIDGVRNSPIDLEPGPGTMEYLNIHDGFIDQSLGQSDVACALGGQSHGRRAEHIRVSDVTVRAGRVVVMSTDDLLVKNISVVAEAQFAEPLFEVRQVNNDLRLQGLYLQRLPGSVGGNLLDVENAGNSTTIDGGVFLEGAAGYPLVFDGTANLRVRGSRIQYDGASPARHSGISVAATIGDADNAQIDEVQIASSTGKLGSAVSLLPRAGHSMQNVRVTSVHSAGSALSGVYLSYHPSATADATPFIAGIDNRPDVVWKQVDQGDNPITSIYPVIAGNPGGVCEMTGQVPPEAAVPAVPGAIYVYQNGDATARYYKSAGVGKIGWSGPLPVP
jgi:hypothetical protein